MITDPAFASALAPLVGLRQSQGYTVKVVDVQDIYDEFSFGQKTPEAIRDFLVRAARSWAKPPRFVLLVGNATNDPRNYQGLNEPDFVPTRIVATAVLETASDDWFADADGDSFAELAVGRPPPGAHRGRGGDDGGQDRWLRAAIGGRSVAQCRAARFGSGRRGGRRVLDDE